jgi:hypothetical protein
MKTSGTKSILFPVFNFLFALGYYIGSSIFLKRVFGELKKIQMLSTNQSKCYK